MVEIQQPTPDELRLEELMDEANVNYAQRPELRVDPPRAVALLEHALRRRSVDKPAAYALARFRRGEWPKRTSRGDRSSPATAYELVHRFIRGYGWDEDYGRREMEEEIDRIYAKRGQRPTARDRELLLSTWDAELLRRYPPEPAIVELGGVTVEPDRARALFEA